MAYFRNIDRFGNEIDNGMPLDFIPTPVSYTPTPDGNTENLNNFIVDPEGNMYFIDIDGDSFKINTSNPLDVLDTIEATPTPTGNTTNLNSVFKDANGDTWVVDYKGDAVKAGSAPVAETVTSVTDTVVGNKIATYTDELGATTDVNETITTLDTFSILGNTITLEYTGEDGVITTKTVDVPLDVVTTITNTLTAGNKIATYTNELLETVDVYETVTSVSDLSIAGSTITLKYVDETGIENTKTVDLPAAVAETVTEITNVLASGNKIATYTNESAVVVDVFETVTSISDFSILGNEITLKYVDEAGVENTKTLTIPSDINTTVTNVLVTGNKIADYTNELGEVVAINETVTTLLDNGDDTYTYTSEDGTETTLTISAAGAPVTIGTEAPTGTSIEGAIHLVTDDGTPTGTVLEQYIYDVESGVWIEMQRNAQDTLKFGTASPTADGEWDGEEYFVTSNGTSAGTVLEQWIWDKQSNTWIKRPSASTPIEKYEKTTATALQASYTLASVPVGAVHVTRNGVDISGAWTWVGGVGTYNSANNYNCTIDANDLLQFHYEAY